MKGSFRVEKEYYGRRGDTISVEGTMCVEGEDRRTILEAVLTGMRDRTIRSTEKYIEWNQDQLDEAAGCEYVDFSFQLTDNEAVQTEFDGFAK